MSKGPRGFYYYYTINDDGNMYFSIMAKAFPQPHMRQPPGQDKASQVSFPWTGRGEGRQILMPSLPHAPLSSSIQQSSQQCGLRLWWVTCHHPSRDNRIFGHCSDEILRNFPVHSGCFNCQIREVRRLGWSKFSAI